MDEQTPGDDLKPTVESGLGSGAHVIVVGNEKGGSGKTTTSMHIAAALLAEGKRVATLDLDVRHAALPISGKPAQLDWASGYAHADPY